MGFNDTMGNYLIAAQMALLMDESLTSNRQRNQLFGRSLDQLLEPYGGNMRTVTLRAALRSPLAIFSLFKNDF